MSKNDDLIAKLKMILDEAEQDAPETVNKEANHSENAEEEKGPRFCEFASFVGLDKETSDDSGNNDIDDSEEESESKKKGGVKTVILSVVFSVAAILLILAGLFLIPKPGKSLVSKFFSKYVTTKTVYVERKSEDVEIGGQKIPSGSNVEIKVETSSVASAVYAKCRDSVVGIRVTRTTGRFWEETTSTVCEGSGVIYTEDGYIITNHHIVETTLQSDGKPGSEYTIQVYLDESLNEFYEAELIGCDKTTDLALLKINVSGLSPVEIVDSDKLEIGAPAVAIGSPGGIDYMNSVTTGIISGVSRNITSDDTTQYDLIQTDTPINPGNSGGALFNEKGELIGICVLKVVADGYENMGFAICSNTVKTVIPALLKDGKVTRTKLGVTIITTYNKTIAEDYGYPVGCYVDSVAKDSCADKAGIKAEDIITEINGTAIDNFYTLRKTLLEYKPGDTVEITVYRTAEKKYETVKVILDEAT